ncbi:MAG: extracellular solute-binding protein [Candidatus Rokubacteria bacterium]|nr:extracellular solute-binding protein [Candidatus Rokubacteria bacterium]MBI2492057.1 extracellular solute-binding protein [Candidatus Rokubacteria bacterium]
MKRRDFLKTTATGAAVLGAPRLARAQGKTGTARVWGEPGPYGGVGVDAMNEWAQKNAPGLKFAIETLSWTDVYPKLMTDLAAGRPAACISVESPIAFQLMAEGLLEPVDDLVDRIGRTRLISGAKWEYWGAWKGKQYVIPAHHQSHLLVVRTDLLRDAGVTKSPAEWNWNDLLAAAKAIKAKTRQFGLCIALGRTIATDYYVISLLHSAGGRMFDAANKSQVVFDSPAAVETFEFIAELVPTMPPGAVGYTFLDVVDSMAKGQSGMVFYWGRVFGRAAEVDPNVFKTMEAYQHAAHPKTGKRLNWNDFQGWAIPKDNNPYVAEVKQALVHLMTSRDWQIRYAQSLVPNVSPVFQDVAQDPRLTQHPFFQTKRRTIFEYYVEALKHASNSGNELLQGISPLAGIVHGRAIIAQGIQQVVIDKKSPAEAVKWVHAQLEAVRREHIRLVV